MQKEFIIPYIISNVVALFLLWASIKKKSVARIAFSLLFIWASWANWAMAHNNPADYLGYSKFAVPVYKDIINGFFAGHITAFVSAIAVAQLFIGIALLLKGTFFRLACVGAIIFLVAISPLGYGSAFPCGLLLAVGLYFLYRTPPANNILHSKSYLNTPLQNKLS